MTYAPCFLWIFLGAPYIEKLRGKKSLNCILSAITAAVVGVIANLTLWFALHVIFKEVDTNIVAGLMLWIPKLSSFVPESALLAIGAGVALLRYKVGMPQVLAVCAFVGILYTCLAH